MHIPDGYLSPQTFIPLYVITIGFWIIAIKKIKTNLSNKYVPYMAMSAAFAFLIQMFNIPIPGTTTGHAVGAGLIAILLGPWTAVISVSVTLIIQALVFGDGGITALGANCFNMAVVMPFVSFWIFKIVKGKNITNKRLYLSAFLAGYIGLCISAIITAFEFGVQPLIAVSADGKPLYAPYPLSIAIPIMAIEYLLFFGIIEGIITALIVKYFIKNDEELSYKIRMI